MPKIRSGISQIGGKFRLCNTLLEYVPYHEFFLSIFCGACWLELSKPRTRYECFNDLDSEIINYLVMVERYPTEFDKMKQGVYGLVSQEICNRIVRGEIRPRNNLERAYFYYYLNKLTFGGDVKKVGSGGKEHVNYSGMCDAGGPTTGGRIPRKDDVEQIKDRYNNVHAHQCGIMRPTDPCRQPQVEKIKSNYVGIESGRSGSTLNKREIEKEKARYEYKTKGFGGIINPRAGLPTLHQEDIENIKDEFKTKGYHGLIDQKLQNARIDTKGCEEAKVNYRGISEKSGLTGNINEVKASFAGINNTRAGNNASNMRDMDKWKDEFKETVENASYRGVILPTVCKDKSVNDAKADYKGLIPLHPFNTAGKKTEGVKEAKANYGGIIDKSSSGWTINSKRASEEAKKQYQAVSYKGINPKTTRPYHNNDCGLLTPLDLKAIERLRYVNLTCYPFQKVYKLFYEAFHVRKGLSRECFIYADPPYPGTEKYYGDKFPEEYHQELIDLMLKTPFNFMLSIGCECEMYLEQLSDWVIVPVDVRYSTDATSQTKSQEYIIMNYEINDVGNMQQDNQTNMMRFMK